MSVISYWNTRKHKNSKIVYYTKNFFRYYVSSVFIVKRKAAYYLNTNSVDEEIIKRVNYYNKLGQIDPTVTEKMICLQDFILPKKKKGVYSNRVYFFDSYEYTQFFDKNYKCEFLFGDIIHVPEIPSITKSRPIQGDNANSVLLNLDKVRHFMFLKDRKKFQDKKNLLVGRAYVRQPHRIKFWEMYFNHPMCNLGQINRNYITNPEWIVEPMSIEEHLNFKFILCLEGNDVASNLKWVMSSNSIAVMPEPKYETWFMEGTLIPDYHYIRIKDDYSDLEEKLNYYIEHTGEALTIIENAHKYIDQFRNRKRENLISKLVLAKYFKCTGQ